jgi:hypothetical protein
MFFTSRWWEQPSMVITIPATSNFITIFISASLDFGTAVNRYLPLSTGAADSACGLRTTFVPRRSHNETGLPYHAISAC